MSSKTRVSILVPCYNEEKNIKKLLLSIVNYVRETKYEVCEILVLDTSNDHTPLIVESLAKDCTLIKHIYLTQRKNVNEAFNILVKQAQGDIIVWLNADITFDSESIERLIETVMNPQVGLASPRLVASKLSYSTIIGRALCFGVRLTDRLRANGKWVLVGRAFAAKRDAISFTIPTHLLDLDSYIYFKVRERGFAVRYVRDAYITFTVPLNWKDFVIENGKFEIGQKQLLREYPRYRNEYARWTLPLFMVRSFIDAASRDVIASFFWLSIKVAFRFLSPIMLRIYNISMPANSTKVLD